MGVLIEDKDFDGTQCGEYDPDTRTAYIDPTMSVEQRICTLQHELIHAKHFDDGLRIMDPAKEECFVFCQIFVGRFGVSFSPFERLFLGRFGFGQSCGLSVIA